MQWYSAFVMALKQMKPLTGTRALADRARNRNQRDIQPQTLSSIARAGRPTGALGKNHCGCGLMGPVHRGFGVLKSGREPSPSSCKPSAYADGAGCRGPGAGGPPLFGGRGPRARRAKRRLQNRKQGPDKQQKAKRHKRESSRGPSSTSARS